MRERKPFHPAAKVERNREIVRRRRAGETLHAIAADLGITQPRVCQIWRNAARWEPLRCPKCGAKIEG